MVTILIAVLILISMFAMLVAFRYVASADPFSFIVLFSAPVVFLLVIRPFVYVYIEGFDGWYSSYRPRIDAYVLVTMAVNTLAYLLFVIGYAAGVKGQPPTRQEGTNSVPLKRINGAARFLLLLGLLGWVFLMQQGGGVLVVLNSLALRNTLFLVDGGFWLLTFTKTLITVGSLALACGYFSSGSPFKGWFVSIFGFLLILSFGGRGAAISVLIGGMICYHYIFRRLRVRWLVLMAVALLPAMLVLGELRLTLTGDGQAGIGASDNPIDLERTIVRFSYLHRAFDYNVLFLRKYWEDGLSYFGEYPHGLTAAVPRSLYPEKADLLGSRLAYSLYGIEDYGISPSFSVGIVSTWGLLSLPFVALLMGYAGARFWRCFANGARGDPRRLVVYCTVWPVFPWFFYDLAGIVLSVTPILLVVLAMEVIVQTRFFGQTSPRLSNCA